MITLKKFLNNKNFYVITNDADVHSLKTLRRKKFLDVGVAEQNMINIAAGLSKEKFENSIWILQFHNFRCYEQLKFSIASHKCNTKIVGIGPGYYFQMMAPHIMVYKTYTRCILYLNLKFLILEMENWQKSKFKN